MKNEKDLQNAETLQERISKGIRDLFGGIRKEIGPSEGNDEEYPEEEEDDLSEENPSSEDFDDVPVLEEEGEAVKIYRKKKRSFPKFVKLYKNFCSSARQTSKSET